MFALLLLSILAAAGRPEVAPMPREVPRYRIFPGEVPRDQSHDPRPRPPEKQNP